MTEELRVGRGDRVTWLRAAQGQQVLPHPLLELFLQPDQVANPQQELPAVEGLGQIIGGARVQSLQALFPAAARCQ